MTHPLVRPLSLLVPALLLAACDSPENPFSDPDNVSVSLSVLPPPGATYLVGDTVAVCIDVHLPYLLDSLVLSTGLREVVLELPDGAGDADWRDTVQQPYALPDTYAVGVSGVRSDGGRVVERAEVVVHGLPPSVSARRSLVQAPEGSACSLAVALSGTGPFLCTWLLGDSLLACTSAVLVFDSVLEQCQGTYRCAVVSAWGADTSGDIHLVVEPVGCTLVPQGSGLNEAIRDATLHRPRDLCPEPGTYEQGTVRVLGTVRFVIE